MLAIDTAMLGHYDTDQLAGFSAASAVQIVMILIAVGLLQGTAILTAQAAGARNLRACGGFFRSGLLVALVVGVTLGLLCLAGGWFLTVLGQDPEVALIGGRAFNMFAWSYPAFCLWLTCTMFLEGLSRPLPGMIITLIALVANGLLDWLFIFGGLGLSPMGAEGARDRHLDRTPSHAVWHGGMRTRAQGSRCAGHLRARHGGPERDAQTRPARPAARHFPGARIRRVLRDDPDRRP